MATASVPHVPTPTTREARGLRLAESRFGEIQPVSPGVWSVPSCSGENVYVVRLRHESCNCPDYQLRSLPCKHLYAARVVKAKTATCDGCGDLLPRRDLVEVLEDNHDGIRYFDGERVCRPCADRDGVIY